MKIWIVQEEGDTQIEAVCASEELAQEFIDAQSEERRKYLHKYGVVVLETLN